MEKAGWQLVKRNWSGVKSSFFPVISSKIEMATSTSRNDLVNFFDQWACELHNTNSHVLLLKRYIDKKNWAGKWEKGHALSINSFVNGSLLLLSINEPLRWTEVVKVMTIGLLVVMLLLVVKVVLKPIVITGKQALLCAPCFITNEKCRSSYITQCLLFNTIVYSQIRNLFFSSFFSFFSCYCTWWHLRCLHCVAFKLSNWKRINRLNNWREKMRHSLFKLFWNLFSNLLENRHICEEF